MNSIVLQNIFGIHEICEIIKGFGSIKLLHFWSVFTPHAPLPYCFIFYDFIINQFLEL